MARLLAERGHGVGVIPPSGKFEALTKELGGLGYTGSNLDPDDLAELVEAALDRFGRIDGMVNCIGHGSKGGIGKISDEDWRLGLDYHLVNMIRMARPVTPVMTSRGRGASPTY